MALLFFTNTVMNIPIQSSDKSQDDFEESVVRAVLEENPVREQGVRDEWEDHVGWHRKEDVYLRGGRSHDIPDLNPRSDPMQKIDDKAAIKNAHHMNSKQSDDGLNIEPTQSTSDVFMLLNSWRACFIVSVLMVCFLIRTRRNLGQGHKIRKK